MRRILSVSVLVGVLLGLTVSAQGPPTNAMNLRVTTDSNSYLGVIGGIAGTAGAINNLGNTLLRTDSNSYLYVTMAAGSSWPIAQTFSGTALGTTSTDGIILSNTTAATSGATVQISPRFKLRGTAWDTAASETVDFFLENLPATAATPTGTFQLGYSLNGAAATYPLKVTSAGQLFPVSNAAAGTPTYSFAAGTTDGVFRPGANLIGLALAGVEDFRFAATQLETIGGNQFAWAQTTIGSGTDLGLARDATGVLRITDGSTGYKNLALDKVSKYKGNIATAGYGVAPIYGYGDVSAATNVGTASIATYTNGAADGTFEVGCNINVTTSTTHSFSCDVTYTDEGNTSRTLVLPVAQLAGSFVASGLITNVTGAGPYESPVMTIRAKASTAITVRTSAGGTFTTVVYNARGAIKQIS